MSKKMLVVVMYLATSLALALQILLVATMVATPSAQAQTFTVLYSFSADADGGSPNDLIRDAVGNLYGTAQFGRAQDGVVFKVDTGGHEFVLHTFTLDWSDGALPSPGLIRDAEGNLYGTTSNGGDLTCSRGGGYGCGTVFKLTLRTRNYEVLYRFAGADGAIPVGTLIRDAAGNLYGTTLFGGTFDFGTVFELDATGKETVLHSFRGADGARPYAGLIRDAAGNLYGTTFYGGNLNCGVPYYQGCGTVFKLTQTSNGIEVLHSFNYWSDGAYPNAGLTMDAAGNLYGTASGAGPSQYGTVFKLTP